MTVAALPRGLEGIDADRCARRELELLLELSDAANRALSAAEVYTPALQAMCQGLGVERAAVLTVDAAGVMRFRAWRNLSEEYRAAVEGHSPWPPDDPQPPRPIFIPDVQADPAWERYLPVFAAEGIAALGFIPLLTQGRLVGKFMVYARRPRAFTAHDERLAQAIAVQVAQAAARAELLESERRERAQAQRLADWSRSLQAVTAELSKALSASQVAEVVVRAAAAHERAATAGVWLLSRDEATLELAASEGYQNVDPFRRLVLDTPARVPVLDAVRTREPIFLHDRAAFRALYPEVERVAAARAEMAIACLPLIAEGRCVGVMAFTFDEPREFAPGEREPLLVLARHCAQALARAQHFDLEARARARAETAQERTALLLEASALLSSSLDFTETLQRLSRLVVPRMADWCAVELATDPDRPAEQLAVAHVDPEKVSLAHELRRRWPPDPACPQGVAQVIRTGAPLLYPTIADELLQASARDAEHLAVLRRLGFTSAMVVPMSARGRTFGAITFVWAETGRRYTREDLELAELLARRAATAIDNALLYRAAQEAIRTREKIMAVVSHDLRNPVHAVQLAATLILRDEEGGLEAAQRGAASILRATERMTRLIQDLLDFTVMQGGTFTVSPASTTVEELIQATLETFTPLAAASEVALEAPVAPWRSVSCDRDRVVQALGNLLANALQVSPAGASVTLSADAADDELRLSVEDQGPGIEPDDLSRLFEPYWRGDRTNYRGTGLGLAIAHGIARAHGGRIEVESTVGRGSRFSLVLPLAAGA